MSLSQRQSQVQLIKNYYHQFNLGSVEGMLACLHSDFVHDVNESRSQNGLEVFRKFLNHMNECYKEELKDIVIMTDESGHRVAAEFVVHGTYLKTDGSLPEARQQKYVIKAGTFFEIEELKIKRVTTYYNLNNWIKQVTECL